MSIRREIQQQKDSNRAALKYFAHFEHHRSQQTELILATQNSGSGRICILGAGNCYDIDLPRIVNVFSEVHLVDLDRVAIANARAKLTQELQGKVHLHAPIDLCGAQKEVLNWRDLKVTPQALASFPEQVIEQIEKELPGRFDCVVSACLISQIMLANRKIMGDAHPLLEAVMVTLAVTHLRLMAHLVSEGGRGLWISDVSSDEIAPLDDFDNQCDGLAYLAQRINFGQVFTYLEPSLIYDIAKRDPDFSALCTMHPPHSAWLWQNGPVNRFLVYACELASIRQS